MPSKYEPFKDLIIAKEIPDKVLVKLIGCSRSALRSIRWKLLNREKNKSYQKKWKEVNLKMVLAQNRKYLSKFKGNNWNLGSPWKIWEEDLILNKGKTDGELSRKIGRPVTAIQQQRSKLRKSNAKR